MSTITLADLLELNECFVRPRFRDSIQLAEDLWKRSGQPRKPRHLANFLECVARTCVVRRIEVFPFFVLRKLQLKRGEWKPKRMVISR